MDTSVAATSAAIPNPQPSTPRVAETRELRPRVQEPNELVKDTAPRTEDPKSVRNNLDNALNKIERFVQPMAAELQFSIDEDSGMQVVKVMDKTTHEIIRQIPSAEVLEIAKALDRLQGLLLKQQA